MTVDVVYEIGNRTEVIGSSISRPLAKWMIAQKKKTGNYKLGMFNIKNNKI